jgi:hypothetical protein
MATTTGLVQRVKLNYDLATAWVFIGPTSTNTTLFAVQFHPNTIGNFDFNEREAAFLKLMVEQLIAGMLAQREVTVHHATNDSRVSAVELSITGGLMPP